MNAISHQQALSAYQSLPNPAPAAPIDIESLLQAYHPDRQPGASVPLQVGANKGDVCHPSLAALLQANTQIEDVDIAGVPVIDTDILVIGGGGAGAAAALSAAQEGANVILATKLRLGDSNTVMAEGGIQAAVGEDDSPQIHFEDTIKGGHFKANRELVAQMVMDGPDVIRWLIRQGMYFDLADDRPMGGNLLRKRPGGASRARILSYRDFTGLEMMRVLREAVGLHKGITVWDRCPVVELLTDEHGQCAGAVLYQLEWHSFIMVRARAVVMATGGLGRLHLNHFPTSNHYGATGDGLVLAYRAGAGLADIDSYQYHPTGVAWPSHRAGGLISEAARSAGATLINGLGQRFIDELAPRDVVASAILKECAEGRGIERDGQVGVFLDTPALERSQPGILQQRLVSLVHLAHKCGIDPAQEPLMVYPTLHYQNGGVVIDKVGQTAVPGLYCVGELSGGIHGRNRLMGNALLDIISFGRRAGVAATAHRHTVRPNKVGLEHVYNWQRQLIRAGLSLDVRAPVLFPTYGNFSLAADAVLRQTAPGAIHRFAASAAGLR